ncbi:MAG: DciA family protein [Pseudomonadota bacterium]
MQRRHHAITLQQATLDAPVLSRLAGLARESGDWLRLAESLIPPLLRASVRPGPIDGPVWCLLVDNNAAAAKLRQLLPALQAHLRSKGKTVETIRLKVHNSKY